jgi:hypothetical protein
MKQPSDKFCAIKYESSGRSSEIFCLPKYCIADAIGQKRDIFIDGQVVSFDVRTITHRGVSQIVANNVVPLFREPLNVDVTTYGEASTIDRWVTTGRNGFLRRANGWDLIYFELDLDDWYHCENAGKLQIGDYVWHGLRPRTTSDPERDKFIATDLIFYSDEEQERFRQGIFESEQPVAEPEPALVLVPEVEHRSALLAPDLRKKSLLEIMQERGRK